MNFWRPGGEVIKQSRLCLHFMKLFESFLIKSINGNGIATKSIKKENEPDRQPVRKTTQAPLS